MRAFFPHAFPFTLTHPPVRVQGGLRNDWFSCFFAAIAGTMPITTFAQNNGVISLTGVASRGAGFACAFWLMLLGIFGKVSYGQGRPCMV